MSDWTTEDIEFENERGEPLAGTLFSPEAPHTTLLLNGGTGIPRQFYRRFSEAAAKRGFSVLTYDYRGVGGSAPRSLKGCTTEYRDWGHYDIPAAIAWLRNRHPDLPTALVGHSAGGQQLGLAHNHAELDAVVFIAVSTGYWAGMPFRMKWFTFFLWHVLVPMLGRWNGYFPAKRMGIGEDLPRGVADEWGQWCLHPAYMAAFFDKTPHGRTFGPTHFQDVKAPTLALCFTDDPIATPANVPGVLDLYTGLNPTIRWIQPSDLGVQSVGHLGYFRSFSAPLWNETFDFLESARRQSR